MKTNQDSCVSEFPIYQPRIERQVTNASLRVDPATFEWGNGLLIRGTNWLGDALMTLPAAYKLARFVPEPCGVFVMCPASLAPLWEAADWVSHVIPLDGKRAGRETERTLWQLRPGIAAVFPNSFGSARDVWRRGIPRRLGRKGRWRGFMLSDRLPAWPRGHGVGQWHQLSYYLEFPAVFGDGSWDADCPPLRIPDATERAADCGITPDEDWLVLAPGAAYGPAKQWPAERFAEVAAWWAKERGRVAVVGTSKERPAGELVTERVPGILNLAGETNMVGLMSILSCAKAVVANDSGAMHLAAGLGRDGVAIFGSTDPVATGPIGGRWIILQDPPDCSPCFQRTCSCTDHPYECLERIAPDTVVRALRQLSQER
jgi:heptosyltransferase-2